MRSASIAFLSGLALFLPGREQGCSAEPRAGDLSTPKVVLRDAPVVQFRGADSAAASEPGDTDCNSPAHWDGLTLYVFNSAGHPWRSSGTDVFHLSQSYVRCEYGNEVNGGRWMECTWKAEDGTLYGWYHNEPGGLCPGTHLTAPKIGAARSTDNGAHWQDLGIVLEAPPGTLNCATPNYYFAGGNGDFCIAVDPDHRFIYFFISTYTGDLAEQGVSVARMDYADRDWPVGKVWKWHGDRWAEPGLGGRVTAIFAARQDWHHPEVDAYWGPSIHWNHYLGQYVMLLNRAIDPNWKQEGVYVSFGRDLAKPFEWTAPRKILGDLRADQWYPSVIGLDAARQETDKLAGRTARLFVRGRSAWEIQFLRPEDDGAQSSSAPANAAPSTQPRRLRVSWGHQSASPRTFRIGFQTNQVAIARLEVEGLEAGDTVEGGNCVTRAGGGDVDALTVDVPGHSPAQPARAAHSIWQYLLDHGEPGQVRRLRDDLGLQPDSPVLTVLLAEDQTRGFTLGLEQLGRQGAMWLPDHDVFVTLADAPVSFAQHLASLQGERVLDRVKREPESTLAQWTGRWEDVGNPHLWNQPWETSWLGTRGHLVGTAARHGSLYKFGVDRWGSIRPDHASPHRFRFDPLWPGWQWRSQRIVNGLPLVVTALGRDGQHCELEQFAAPLPGAGPSPRGEIHSVFLTRVTLSGTGPVNLGFRLATENTNRHPELRVVAGQPAIVDGETGAVWLRIEPGEGLEVGAGTPFEDPQDPRIEFDVVGELVAGEVRTVVLKLASPILGSRSAGRLAEVDFDQARRDTVDYWESWLAQGARFEVPEAEVNHLFRANLWHALMLPRHRTGEQGAARIDLPYSNFAYGQYNADWPINQAVYVNYMIHGLRGYFAVAEEELGAMFHTQQRPDGRVGGYAEWGVYTPGMLYSIAQNYLLSADRASFERLLPASLKALDWCLAEVARGQESPLAPGLIVAPLNDLTHAARAWAFPNAYFVGGLDMFGRALAAHGHPRAASVRAAAAQMRADVEREFARASVRSPVVQLADGTWQNYVPCDAMTPRRLLDEWYPTDVDTGALHLARLAAIDPRGWLTTALLRDHEDNLFLNQWGMANEPVYNQQATVYLHRDEPEAAIRAFYSMMACAFSHGQFSPLEHRWAWGQYFGPPSTDGAWFELYRNMLLNELQGERTLFLGQAIPRAWLTHGRRVAVEAAPTHFGPVNLRIESNAQTRTLLAWIEFLSPHRPDTVLLRLRHPERATLRSVRVNGSAWIDFDAAREWIRIPKPAGDHYTVVAGY